MRPEKASDSDCFSSSITLPSEADQRDMLRGAKQMSYKEGTLASLIRFINRGPRRHGLCRWHCRELTVSCEARCEAMATMYTASYIRAASVCGGKHGTCHQFHLYYLPLPMLLPFLPCCRSVLKDLVFFS